MFATVSWQKIRPGTLNDFLDAAVSSESPDIAAAPGFVARYVVMLSAERYLIIRLFTEKEHADRWAEVVADHARRTELDKYLDHTPGASGRVGGVVVAGASG